MSDEKYPLTGGTYRGRNYPANLSNGGVLRCAPAEETPWFPEALKLLVQYYESPLWRHDYEMDEQGCLPRNLKRGILSQDGIYLFLEQWKEKQTEDPLDRLSAKIQQEGY